METVWTHAGDKADQALDELETAIEAGQRPGATFMALWLMQHRATRATLMIAGLWADDGPGSDGKIEARRRVDRLRVYLIAAGEWDGNSGFGIEDIDAIRVAYKAVV